MAWYDVFAGFYDQSVERVYRRYRRRTVQALGLREGACVLDLACGTGPNFEPLVEAVGSSGLVVGVDHGQQKKVGVFAFVAGEVRCDSRPFAKERVAAGTEVCEVRQS